MRGVGEEKGKQMQTMVNFIFVFAALFIIAGSFGLAGESSKKGGDYCVGWIWGLLSGLCIWALWHGFSTGLFWV